MRALRPPEEKAYTISLSRACPRNMDKALHRHPDITRTELECETLDSAGLTPKSSEVRATMRAQRPPKARPPSSEMGMSAWSGAAAVQAYTADVSSRWPTRNSVLQHTLHCTEA